MQDASLVLQTVQTTVSTYLCNLERQPFTNVEVALRMLYLVGEAITDKVIHVVLCVPPETQVSSDMITVYYCMKTCLALTLVASLVFS